MGDILRSIVADKVHKTPGLFGLLRIHASILGALTKLVKSLIMGCMKFYLTYRDDALYAEQNVGVFTITDERWIAVQDLNDGRWEVWGIGVICRQVPADEAREIFEDYIEDYLKGNE